MSKTPARDMLEQLDDTDLEFIAELVLQSGSLKGLASTYAVSYPTIRTRLNRLIERVCDAMADREIDPVREMLADLVNQGKLDIQTAHQLQGTVQKDRDTRSSPNLKLEGPDERKHAR